MTGEDLIVIGFCGLFGYGLVWFALSPRNRRVAGERTSRPDPEEPPHEPHDGPDWYQVLEVPATATMDEIRQAYRRKMMQYHPDRVEALGLEFKRLAESRTRQINRAYEIACKMRG